MKKLFKLLFLIQVLVACSPDDLVVDPEENIPPKIRTVEVIKNDISDVYSFQYNEDNSKLISVFATVYCMQVYPIQLIMQK
ncbi:MAG: hypothetical protein IPQ19_09300 [Bacteroidetes bacterium]|nr:hypothetical protein [Bacteroidota bacterium]